MDLPVIETPIFPRWVWIEEITYSHIPIATLITAYMLLAPLFEYIGYRTGNKRWDRLAYSMIWFALILFSPGAALGTGIPIFIIGAWPEFWSRWANLFYWPLIAQFVFFTLEVFFLFFMYYMTWEKWQNRKRLHISMGVLAALWGYMVQLVWDALGAYMMTPGDVALPQVAEPVGWSLPAFLNPSFPFLFAHRTFGNFSYVMLLTGGVLAMRYWGQKRKNPGSENEQYFHWASRMCFTIGFLTFFAQPVIGWFYARVIQHEAPIAYMAMMGGHSTHYFLLKLALIVFFVTVGGTYVIKQHGSNAMTWGITAGALVVLLIAQVHPPLKYFGSDIAWRAVCAVLILAYISWIWYCRGKGTPDASRWQWMMLAAGLAAFMTFALGGFLREHTKNPDTVYGEIAKPETTPKEAARYLVYNKWLMPRGEMPAALDRPDMDWVQEVNQARVAGQVDLTDSEAETIIQYLEEYH
jgi:cytochrome bd-type quinol oxidase subunit 1